MIASLRDFIPVVGNTHDLQNRQSELGKWYMSTVAKVNARVDAGNTSQGFYVVAADGTAYGFNNNRSIERVLGFMADGLKKFKAAPPTEVPIDVLSYAPVGPPAGASVVRIYSRILPVPEGCAESNANLQRDHLWILADEAKSLANGEVPESLQLRLCRFTFVDAVRGEPDFWQAGQIKDKSFSVKKSGGGYVLTGSFSMASGKQSLSGAFESELTIAGDKVTAFKGFASTVARGSGTYTQGAPEGEFALKFAFVLAPKAIDTVAPQAAMFGREYLTGR